MSIRRDLSRQTQGTELWPGGVHSYVRLQALAPRPSSAPLQGAPSHSLPPAKPESSLGSPGGFQDVFTSAPHPLSSWALGV